MKYRWMKWIEIFGVCVSYFIIGFSIVAAICFVLWFMFKSIFGFLDYIREDFMFSDRSGNAYECKDIAYKSEYYYIINNNNKKHYDSYTCYTINNDTYCRRYVITYINFPSDCKQIQIKEFDNVANKYWLKEENRYVSNKTTKYYFLGEEIFNSKLKIKEKPDESK